MKRSVIMQAWIDHFRDALPEIWTITQEEEILNADSPRPPKPYITLKIISGPGRITIDDEMVLNKKDKHTLVGQRSYTISAKAFGQDYMDGLNDASTVLDDPDFWENLRDKAQIAVTGRTSVIDISAKLETGFERRASLDIFFNSVNNKETNIGTIEKVVVSGQIETEGGKIINTNLPQIN